MRSLLLRPVHRAGASAWQGLALFGLMGLLAHSMAWTLGYSPGAPYPGWMVGMTLPLLAPLRGLLHGRRYTAQWTALLALPYLMGAMVGIYGYLAPPRFTAAPDAVAAVLQGVFATALLIGCAYFAAATAPSASPDRKARSRGGGRSASEGPSRDPGSAGESREK